jgi:hypothetical protein
LELAVKVFKAGLKTRPVEDESFKVKIELLLFEPILLLLNNKVD